MGNNNQSSSQNNNQNNTPTPEEIAAAERVRLDAEAAAAQIAVKAPEAPADESATDEALQDIAGSSSLQDNATVAALQSSTPDRERGGRLTRAGMEAAIREGGSVQLPDGRTVTRISELPTLAETVKGDPQAEAEARRELEAKVNDLQKQLDSLK